jgi:mutator protein MutT
MSTKKANQKLPHYQVSAGLIRNNGKILITQRRFSDNCGGLWEFPGGKQKSQETLAQCLIREISEELNIQILVDKKLMSVTHNYDHAQITLHIFLCSLQNGTPESKQVQDWQWIDLSKIDQYDFTEADRKVVQKLKALKHIPL